LSVSIPATTEFGHLQPFGLAGRFAQRQPLVVVHGECIRHKSVLIAKAQVA